MKELRPQNDDEDDHDVEDEIGSSFGTDDSSDALDDHSSPNSDEVGRAFGRIMRRDQIRHDFWTNIEEPSQDTSCLGFTVFDRYGTFRSLKKKLRV